MPEFHDAAPTDYIGPGETTTLQVDGFPIALANVDGEFYAFSNLCPHQGTGLGGRPLEQGCIITCSGHSSQYDVRTGECVTPASGDGFAGNLLTFETRVVDDVVQIKL